MCSARRERDRAPPRRGRGRKPRAAGAVSTSSSASSPRQPRHDQHLSAGHRPRSDHRHRPRLACIDDVRHRRRAALGTDARRERGNGADHRFAYKGERIEDSWATASRRDLVRPCRCARRRSRAKGSGSSRRLTPLAGASRPRPSRRGGRTPQAARAATARSVRPPRRASGARRLGPLRSAQTGSRDRRTGS
jgi:hypothetical protein